jgi:uncharacterized membrane protein YbhN (UPF0104 family)
MFIFFKLFFATLLLMSSLYFINEKLSTEFIKIFNYDFYILIFSLLFMSQIILSLRWFILVKSFNIKINFLQSLNFSFKFTSFANISFSGGSEIFRLLNLKTSNLKFSQMSILILTEKFLSAISLLTILMIGIVLNFGEETYYFFFLFLFICFIWFYFFFKLTHFPYINYLNYEFYLFKKNVFRKLYYFFGAIILSIISQLLSIYLYYLFFMKFGEVDIKHLLFVIPITNFLISMSFFTFNGIGVREILFISFSSFFLISSQTLFDIGVNVSFIITIYMFVSFLVSSLLVRPKIRLK